jgi:hypothetical protein
MVDVRDLKPSIGHADFGGWWQIFYASHGKQLKPSSRRKRSEQPASDD